MPSAAERVRTLIEGSSSAVLVIPGVDSAAPEQLVPEERTIGPEGEVLLLFAADSPAVRAATHAQDDDVAAVLEITDVAPVAVPHRIRGRGWIAGWLTPVPGPAGPGRKLLKLEVGEAGVDDLWGEGQVEPEELAVAAPDPLAAREAELLQHLASAHGDQVGWLCGLVDGHDGCDGGGSGPRRRGPRTAVPVALDRFGLRVRFTGEQGTYDVRFEFPRPVHRPEELGRAMHKLFDAARASVAEGPGA